MRLCSHVVAAIRVASTLVELPQYQDVMDHRWLKTVRHVRTWRAQHTSVIIRVSLAGHWEQLKQEHLIRPRMHARPGRKQIKPHQPSQSMPRRCPACGMTVKPNVVVWTDCMSLWRVSDTAALLVKGQPVLGPK